MVAISKKIINYEIINSIFTDFIGITPITKEDRWEPLFLEHIFNDTKNRLRIDEEKIFLTGVSMGGFGVWDWAMKFPIRFTAIASIFGF